MSVAYRPSVGRVSAERRWLSDRISANMHVGQDLTDISIHTRPTCRSTLGRHSADTLPTLADTRPIPYRHSADTLPTLADTRPIPYRHSAATLPTLGRYPTDTRPILYRHSAATLLTLGRYPTDTRRHSADTLPTLGCYPTDTRPILYRHSVPTLYRHLIGSQRSFFFTQIALVCVAHSTQRNNS